MELATDIEQLERAEKELNGFVERHASAKDRANFESYEERERDRRRLRAMYEENRTLWIHHHARMAEEFAKLSADHARRAKVLEERMIDA